MRARVSQPVLLPSGDALLLDYAERLAKHLPGRRAVHIHLSQLQPTHRRGHHLRMAAANFDNLVRRSQGQCFCLHDGDVVVVLKDISVAVIDEVVLGLRYMFDEDPLVHAPDDAVDQPTFCTWYNLEQDYPRFLAMARDLRRAAPVVPRLRGVELDGPERAPKVELHPFDPLRLSRFEQVITTADLTPLLRRQPICRLPENGPPSAVANELFVSIDALGRRAMPDVDLRSDPWLFQYLIGLLDRRVMVALPVQERTIQLPTALNLTLRALQSADFIAFDAKLREVTQKVMVAEVHWVDALRDVANFTFTREFLRVRNWRLSLDGLTAANYALIQARKLGADYVKLAWNIDLADPTPSKARAEFLDAVERDRGQQKLVLMHCGEAAAIRMGRQLGISLFQGRHVDAVLKGQAAA
jgi:hypothetical protein